ncbi:hypothetical protein [Flavobacterium sp.]|jgi:hypothetical protein|uniref:hypothetical protein n=1 Tax=Flavobacterium sp. TaxID=239 RepID=UPI0037BE57B2
MTKKLEELLNLPTSVSEDLAIEDSKDFIEQNQEILTEVDAAINKIDAALPLVQDLDAGDAELDELAKLAKDRFEDLVDLGMNVEPRFSGVILQTASTLLGHAITAKTAKMDKKLRTISLQLQKARLDQQIKKDAGKTKDDEEPIDGQGVVLDRNELLKHILGKNTK